MCLVCVDCRGSVYEAEGTHCVLMCRYIHSRNLSLLTKQLWSATTCSEVCLEVVCECVRCLYPTEFRASKEAEYLYADFKRTEAQLCLRFTARWKKWGCTAGVFFVHSVTPYLYVLVPSFAPWSSSSFDRSYGSPM